MNPEVVKVVRDAIKSIDELINVTLAQNELREKEILLKERELALKEKEILLKEIELSNKTS